MPDKVQRITDLIIKNLTDSLSDLERQELQEWLDISADNQKWYRQVMDNKFYLPRLLKSYYNADNIGERRWDKIIGQPDPVRAKVYSIRRGLMAVAAVILLISVTAISWLFWNQKKIIVAPQIVKRTTNDVPAPVGNRTFLKLANGNIIFLDSLKNGPLSKQGNAKVTKINPGLLSYNTLPESPTEVFLNTITTQRGGVYQVILPDGTKVWLNSASSLTFPTYFTGKERDVTLTGEAYFEVSHLNADHPSSYPEGIANSKPSGKTPFIVLSNGVKVQVTGTHFDVNAYGEEGVTKTTLLEGSVKVTATKEKASVILKPGEQSVVVNDPSATNGKKDEIKVVKDADTDQAIAWMNGMFQFSIDDLDAVMRQLARWYDIEVLYAGSKPNIQLSGSVSRNVNLSSVLKVLEISGVHCKIEGRKVIVMP